MVGRGAALDECIVTDGVRVPAGSSYRRSILRATPVGRTDPFDPCTLSHASRQLPSEQGSTVDEQSREAQTCGTASTLPARHGLVAVRTTVVPLTGDASDRRYFRILIADGARSCWRCTPVRSTSPRCRSRTSRELLRQMPLPVPAILGHSDALGILALEDLGDVTLQAHLGAAHHRTRRALPPGGRAHRARCSAAARSSLRRYLPYRIAFDVEKLTWELDSSRSISSRATAARADAGAARTRSRASGRRSPPSSPPNRACSATATITAAT